MSPTPERDAFEQAEEVLRHRVGLLVAETLPEDTAPTTVAARVLAADNTVSAHLEALAREHTVALVEARADAAKAQARAVRKAWFEGHAHGKAGRQARCPYPDPDA